MSWSTIGTVIHLLAPAAEGRDVAPFLLCSEFRHQEWRHKFHRQHDAKRDDQQIVDIAEYRDEVRDQVYRDRAYAATAAATALAHHGT
jgi:hypothetical protein